MIPRKRAKPRQLGIAAQVAGVKPVKRKTKYARRKRWTKYLAWLRTQPCAISSSLCSIHDFLVEAAHVGPEPAAFRKCDDRMAIPLSARYHRLSQYSHHRLTKPGEFEKFWGINLRELWLKCNAEYAKIDPDFVPLEAE